MVNVLDIYCCKTITTNLMTETHELSTVSLNQKSGRTLTGSSVSQEAEIPM